MPQMFENLFAEYDKDGDGALTLRETFNLMKGHRCAADPFGVSIFFYSALHFVRYIATPSLVLC